MNYLALYRKYRPKTLDEVVGQVEIKKILASSVKNGTITHAYLFSGPRGTGKTTMAKILAKMVNCECPIDGNACGKCDSCMTILNSNDIIEIDAASNNGVDEIRDLREKANLVPNTAKYKVYIIDEVHMLTTQAFNALLKTLEEPPRHVIFILATTEYYKIPLTITSRCQKFQFSTISNEDIVGKLKEISKAEKIKITDDALLEIAKISDGGMRDSINFLDQLRSFNSGKITIDDVYEVCGNVSIVEIEKLFASISENNVELVTEFFERVSIDGKNYNKLFEDLIGVLKDVALLKKGVSAKYFRYDQEYLKLISERYTQDEIFYLIDEFVDLVDKLKNTSRLSVYVTAKVLSIMNKISNKYVKTIEDKQEVNNTTGEENYEMAFDFTDDSKKEESKSTEPVDEKKDDVVLVKAGTDDENKDVIINNAFALANKELKKDLQEKFGLIGDYLTDKKYSSVASSLLDTTLQVVGKEYLIFSANYDAVVDKVYEKYKAYSEFLDKVFNGKYSFAVITQSEWETLRTGYINNIKNGYKYEVMELKKNEKKQQKSNSKKSSVVDKLFDIVGEDIVEFK